MIEHIEMFLQTVSCIGVIGRLSDLSPTDIAVVLLASKPAFVVTAGLLVGANIRRRRTRVDQDRSSTALPAGKSS